MNIAHKRQIAFKISENDLWYFFFNSNKFYLCLLVKKLQRIKVSYFEDFMHHYSVNEWIWIDVMTEKFSKFRSTLA